MSILACASQSMRVPNKLKKSWDYDLRLQNAEVCYEQQTDKGQRAAQQERTIQAVIAEEPEPWIIMKRRMTTLPIRNRFVFSRILPSTRAEIPLPWFEGRQSEKITETMQHSLRHARSCTNRSDCSHATLKHRRSLSLSTSRCHERSLLDRLIGEPFHFLRVLAFDANKPGRGDSLG
jgi:hypothetical protein